MTLPEADTYKLRLSVRHHSMEALSKLSTMSLWLDRPLKSSVPVPFFSDRHALAANDAFSGGLTLPRGATCSLLAAAPAADKLPKGLEPGDVLTVPVWVAAAPKPPASKTILERRALSWQLLSRF